MAKYLKTWMGVTSGTFMGRDDGYPETKSCVFDNIEALIRAFGVHKNEKYYELTEMDTVVLEDQVKRLLSEKEEQLRQEQLQKDLNEYERLKGLLGK